MATANLHNAAVYQMQRVKGQFQAIQDDILDNEYDGARSHLEILKRQLSDLDEKLFAAATDMTEA